MMQMSIGSTDQRLPRAKPKARRFLVLTRESFQKLWEESGRSLRGARPRREHDGAHDLDRLFDAVRRAAKLRVIGPDERVLGLARRNPRDVRCRESLVVGDVEDDLDSASNLHRGMLSSEQ